jgi:hypothetical protein
MVGPPGPPGRIGSLESILGLLKSFKIRALVYFLRGSRTLDD